jgi:hypothetical protein
MEPYRDKDFVSMRIWESIGSVQTLREIVTFPTKKGGQKLATFIFTSFELAEELS